MLRRALFYVDAIRCRRFDTLALEDSGRDTMRECRLSFGVCCLVALRLDLNSPHFHVTPRVRVAPMLNAGRHDGCGLAVMLNATTLQRKMLISKSCLLGYVSAAHVCAMPLLHVLYGVKKMGCEVDATAILPAFTLARQRLIGEHSTSRITHASFGDDGRLIALMPPPLVSSLWRRRQLRHNAA